MSRSAAPFPLPPCKKLPPSNDRHHPYEKDTQ